MSYQIYYPQERKASLLYLLEHVSIQVNNIWNVDHNCVSWKGRGCLVGIRLRCFQKQNVAVHQRLYLFLKSNETNNKLWWFDKVPGSVCFC